MKPIKITVTKKHLLRGVRNSTSMCPIALAVKDCLMTESVEVGSTDMTVNGFAFDLTRAERDFVRRFDEGKIRENRYRPFKFILERPGETIS